MEWQRGVMVKGNLRSTHSGCDSVSYVCCFPMRVCVHISLSSNLVANTYWPTSPKLAMETDHKMLERKADEKSCTGFIVRARLKKFWYCRP